MIKSYTYNQLRLFTILFGLYLFFQFLFLIPESSYLLDSEGSFVGELVITFLPFLKKDFLVKALLVLFSSLSLLLILNKKPKPVLICLTIAWLGLFLFNPLRFSFESPFILWLLVILASVYPVDDKVQFRLSKKIYVLGWAVLVVGYLLSAFIKLRDPDWSTGIALAHFLKGPYARNYFLTHWLLGSESLLSFLSILSLILDFIFLPLVLWSRTRVLGWVLLFVSQLFALMILQSPGWIEARVLFHLFVFNPSWVRPQVNKNIIIFFDGVCGLCNRSVDFVLVEDRSKKIKFSPLQGKKIYEVNPNFKPENMNTLYVWNGKTMLEKTKAWQYVACHLGGVWRLLALFSKLVPLFVANLIYDLIARYRYKIFGQKDQCRLPSPQEKERFFI